MNSVRLLSKLRGNLPFSVLLLACLEISGGAAFADTVYERLKSFGFADQLGHTPGAGLVAGSQGEFYGTTSEGGAIGGGAGVVYRFTPQNSNYTILRIFGTAAPALRTPGPLLLGSDGALYGTASSGGQGQGYGGIFKINTNGTGYADVVRFGTNAVGANPQARLMQATGGRIYGTTYSGGLSNAGTIFAVNPDGSDYQVLHQFVAGADDGARPRTGLVKGSDGALYGTSESGGGILREAYGTIFKINEDGTGYEVLHKFNNTNGALPRGELLPISGGFLVGNTMRGGTPNRGTIFRIHQSGSGFVVLHEFQGTPVDGANPIGELRFGTNGMIFGTTTSGGSNSVGVIFTIAPDGSGYSVLHHFPGSGKSVGFSSGLVVGDSGNLYGTRTGGDGEGLGFIFAVEHDGQPLSVLRKFSQNGGDVRGGGGSLLRGSDGWFYGASSAGGWNNAGAVFRFQEGGTNYQLVRSLATNEGSGGMNLSEPLPGVLFGAAERGGTNDLGTIFRLNTDGSDFQILHEFGSVAGGGNRPLGGLILARDGNLYGATIYGGQGFGAIYRISPTGSGFQVIYAFSTGQIMLPICTLVQGSDDMLYGTADGGGVAGPGPYGLGGVFKVSTNGTDFTVLHDFGNDAPGGGGAEGALLIGPDQALYGVNPFGPGRLYRITQDGSQFSVIHQFTNTDGSSPKGTLCLGQDGMFYGATQFGGTYGGQGGTLFKCATDGSGFAVLHSFPFPIDPEGGRPTGGLVQGADGWLYGMTPLGGEFSNGVIFRVHPTELTNHAPTLVAALPDQSIYALQPFTYTVPDGTFFESDWSQTVTYSASNLPPNVTFDPLTRTFQGTPPAGTYDITVVGTDNGLPASLSGSDVYRLSVLLPDVRIQVTATNVIVNWPDGLAWYYDLEECSSLAPATPWTNLGMPGGYYIGNRRYTTLPLKSGPSFYRLKSR